MPQRIIVAFDGSDLAREALQHALQIARQASLPVLVLTIIEPVPLVPTVGDPLLAFDPSPAVIASPEEIAAQSAERRADAEKLLQSLRPVIDRSGVKVELQAVEGELIPTLCRTAREGDLIALGKKGRFRAAGLGSATRELVTTAPAPVMVVSVPFMPLRRVLAVFENTDAGRRAVALAHDLAGKTRWPLSILAVGGHGVYNQEAASMAKALAQGAPVVTMPDDVEEAQAIEHAAEEARDAVVVMGAYAESWLHQAIFGAAAPRVLKDIGVPVILAH